MCSGAVMTSEAGDRVDQVSRLDRFRDVHVESSLQKPFAVLRGIESCQGDGRELASLLRCSGSEPRNQRIAILFRLRPGSIPETREIHSC